jgi:hypothetical protein
MHATNPTTAVALVPVLRALAAGSTARPQKGRPAWAASPPLVRRSRFSLCRLVVG